MEQKIKEIREKIESAETMEDIEKAVEELDILLKESEDTEADKEEKQEASQEDNTDSTDGEDTEERSKDVVEEDSEARSQERARRALNSSNFDVLGSAGKGESREKGGNMNKDFELREKDISEVKEFREILDSSKGQENVYVPEVIIDRFLYEAAKGKEGVDEVLSLLKIDNIKGVATYLKGDEGLKAQWVAESAGSPDGQVPTTKKIQLGAHLLQVKVEMTRTAYQMGVDEFVQYFADLMLEAVKAEIVRAFISGEGRSSGQPLGVVNDDDVVKLNAKFSFESLYTDVYGKLSSGFRSGSFVMTNQVFSKLQGITDTSGQPVARVNFGLDGAPKYRLFGLNVITLDEDIMDAEDADIVYVSKDSYVVNFNEGMTFDKWKDFDKNLNKAMLTVILDGEAIQPQGIKVIKMEDVVTPEVPETRGVKEPEKATK